MTDEERAKANARAYREYYERTLKTLRESGVAEPEAILVHPRADVKWRSLDDVMEGR